MLLDLTKDTNINGVKTMSTNATANALCLYPLFEARAVVIKSLRAWSINSQARFQLIKLVAAIPQQGLIVT